LVQTVFTDEDKRNLKTLAEELPKLRSLVEELMETLEILSDEKLMKSIKSQLKRYPREQSARLQRTPHRAESG
jgi:hypothetical protein